MGKNELAMPLPLSSQTISYLLAGFACFYHIQINLWLLYTFNKGLTTEKLDWQYITCTST